jgi:hypothetical protein
VNEARVQQAMEQAQMSVHVGGMEFGKNVPIDQKTVTLPYPEWERLLLAILPVDLKEEPAQ